MAIEPEVGGPEKVPTTLGAVPPALSTRPLPPVVSVIESAVSTGPPEKVPVTVFAVPPLVTVMVEPFVIVTAPADGWAVKVPVFDAAVPALALRVVPSTATFPVPLEPLNVPV